MINAQIEEIARIICKSGTNKGVCESCGFKKRCWKFVDAEAIYNAGYRKQSEETPPPVVIKRYDKWISVDTMLPEDVSENTESKCSCWFTQSRGVLEWHRE